MIKKIPGLLIVLLIIFIVCLPFFIKVKIECKSQYGECPQDINSALLSLNPKSLFDARRKSENFLKKNFIISNFSTQFKLPNILLVNVIAKKPYFALKVDSGKFELVDKKGIVLATTDNSSLPTVSVTESDIKVGDTISDNDLFALNIVSGLYQMYQVGYGKIENDALVVDMPTGVRVIFPLGDNEDINILLGGLRLIYSKVTTDYVGIYSQIDMRYKNPVLR